MEFRQHPEPAVWALVLPGEAVRALLAHPRPVAPYFLEVQAPASVAALAWRPAAGPAREAPQREPEAPYPGPAARPPGPEVAEAAAAEQQHQAAAAVQSESQAEDQAPALAEAEEIPPAVLPAVAADQAVRWHQRLVECLAQEGNPPLEPGDKPVVRLDRLLVPTVAGTLRTTSRIVASVGRPVVRCRWNLDRRHVRCLNVPLHAAQNT